MAATPKEFVSGKARVTWLRVILSVIVVALFGRCAFLLVVQAPELRDRVEYQQSSGVEFLLPRRGQILDRNGKALAQSVEASRIDIRPAAIPPERQEEVATFLAEVSGTPTLATALLEKIRGSLVPFPFLRQTDMAIGEKVQQANLPGVDVFSSQKRVYPFGPLAAQLLGFVHYDFGGDQREELFGLEGLERSYEDQLHGKSGNAVYLLGPTGERLPVDPVEHTPAMNGNDIILTIDSVVQNVAEDSLERAAKENQATSGSAIVLDARNGEVLAMASYPDFDPNEWTAASPTQFKNNATQFVYEPGSVFKFVVGAAALEEGVITPSTVIHDDGPIEVSGWTFACPSEFGGPHGAQDLYNLFKNSCNVGFIQVGQLLGEERLRRYSDLFGIGRPCALEVPQAQGQLPPTEDWYDVLLATASFGYGFYCTPLQIAGAFQAVANDGRYVPPHLVKEIRDSGGKVVYSGESASTRQVISQKTAIQLREALKGVVEAKVPDSLKPYGVVGKTGTAVVYREGEATTLNNTTFVGAFPADNPRIVIMVNVNEPQVEFAYAVRVCVPIFMEIAGKIVDILRLPPP
ncbi:MAG: penicillin-binding protein 2 [bacterium]